MSKIGDLMLLNALSSKSARKDDGVASFKKISKLLKAIKDQDEIEAAKKKKEEPPKKKTWYEQPDKVAVLIFFAIPIFSVINFWLLTTLMVTAVDKLQHIK